MTDHRAKQVAAQFRAVSHMATVLARVSDDMASLHDAGHADTLIDMHGERTAAEMEILGDILNGMDAVDSAEDAWLNPVFTEAHRLWPRGRKCAHCGQKTAGEEG